MVSAKHPIILELITRNFRFKLHLRPAESASQVDSNIPSLLPGMNVVKVMADFMRYLFHCAREYITQADPNGERLWTSFGNNIDFVLSHPNGWEGAQQGKMREAAVIAGLIPADEDSQSRIQFVTEGEASLHYCLQNGLATHFRKVSLRDDESSDDRSVTGKRYHHRRCRRRHYRYYSLL